MECINLVEDEFVQRIKPNLMNNKEEVICLESDDSLLEINTSHKRKVSDSDYEEEKTHAKKARSTKKQVTKQTSLRKKAGTSKESQNKNEIAKQEKKVKAAKQKQTDEKTQEKKKRTMATSASGNKKTKLKMEIQNELSDEDAEKQSTDKIESKSRNKLNSDKLKKNIKKDIKEDLDIKVSAPKRAKKETKSEKQEQTSDNESSDSEPDGGTTTSRSKKELVYKPVVTKNQFPWSDTRRLAERKNLDYKLAQDLISLFEAGNTIPFIARYRRFITNDMPVEQLRDVRETFEEICACKKKTDNIITAIKKVNKYSVEIERAILNCRNAEELEYVYAPFKAGQKRTLAERAKELGLEPVALDILYNRRYSNLNSFINPNKPGLKNYEEVQSSIMHIIAHVITSETETLEYIRRLRSDLFLKVESKQAGASAKQTKTEDKKFQLYFNFSCPIQHIKPHQTLAMNRGENLKILSIKVVVPDYALHRFSSFVFSRYGQNRHPERLNLLKNSIEDAYKRKVQPLIVRQTRADLNKVAERASVEIFAKNLKKLLLISPLKGKVILGIDPGFKVGCKVAVINPHGDVLDTSVIHPHTGQQDKAAVIIKDLLEKNNCTLIAIGNGTACRETEKWLSNLITTSFFSPLNVHYTIVDECGASIYSCSPEAKKEFKNFDPLLISAVSLARRIQDPLAEMVKVDPQHLGVGMYQHDVNKKLLETTLNEIVSECVSFVGVDLNTASQCLLRRVAGLTDLRATNILSHRQKHGPFTNRWQIKDVKGIGEKVFEQCAGFLRIGPANAADAKKFYKKIDTNPLDSTYIHPESYELTEKLLEKFGATTKNIGTPNFIVQLQTFLKGSGGAVVLAEQFNSSVCTIQLILDALQKPFDYDLRDEMKNEPIFRKEITSLQDLRAGMVVTGHIRNVTSFGAFVDIGVGTNGLVYHKLLENFPVQLGDRVEVKILSVEIDRERIGLQIEKIL